MSSLIVNRYVAPVAPAAAVTPAAARVTVASHRNRLAPLSRVASQAWAGDRRLTLLAAFMVLLLVPTAFGLWLDPRLITGAPAWLKPSKFAISIAIYCVTLAWFFTFIPEWIRTRRVIGWMTAFAMVVEMAIIGSQAWRGTTSHFNTATPYDAVLFMIMGSVIVTQTVR